MQTLGGKSDHGIKHLLFLVVLRRPAMDNSPEGVSHDSLNTLSYDDNIAYEEQLPTTHLSNDSEQVSLANRIGNTKVYLLAESSMNRVGKVRW